MWQLQPLSPIPSLATVDRSLSALTFTSCFFAPDSCNSFCFGMKNLIWNWNPQFANQAKCHTLFLLNDSFVYYVVVRFYNLLNYYGLVEHRIIHNSLSAFPEIGCKYLVGVSKVLNRKSIAWLVASRRFEILWCKLVLWSRCYAFSVISTLF